nr:MAG TPA: hypothetical protein [Caudoviricetes sp.]
MMAAVFHFQPSEIWEMDASEMNFWTQEAEKICENLNRGSDSTMGGQPQWPQPFQSFSHR